MMADERVIVPARVVFAGRAAGEALVSPASLSFWGGLDPATGTITDVHHELCGTSITGKVFCFPRGAGSSSGCGVLMETVCRGTNPAAIVNIETEAVLALGPIIARELYGRSFPIVTVSRADFARLVTGMRLCVDAVAGLIEVL